MVATRLLACVTVGVALLGAAAGGFLALPSEMSTQRHAPTVITAHDPNYVAYLKMLASLGPAPARRHTARPAAAAWYEVQPSGLERSSEVLWTEGDQAADSWEAVPPGRIGPPYRVVGPVNDNDWPLEAYQEEAPPRPSVYYRANNWRHEDADPSRAYGRGWSRGDEPTPPPPPRPSDY